MSTDARWLATMPEVYDRCLGPALFAPFAAHVAAEAAALAPRRVLELAAGTGILTAELVAALPTADITATDVNPAMMAVGQARAPGPTWRQADAQQLDLPDNSFDLVACQFGLMFFPDKPAAFAETARVLAPGGSLLYTVWDAAETSDFAGAMVQSLRAVLPEDPPEFIVRGPHGYHDPDQLAADLRAGGVVDGRVEPLVLRGATASAQVITEGFCLGTPLRFELAERGPLDELTGRLQQEMVSRLGSGPVTGDLGALLVTGRAPS